MANHVRQQIREAAKTALTGLTTTGANVFVNRLRAIPDGKLPCLTISTGDEEITDESIDSGGVIERKCELIVTCIDKITDAIENKLDLMAEEVETALSVTSFGGKVRLLMQKNSRPEFDADGEKPVGRLVMIYEATYYTGTNAPTVAL